ncbi:hypothetical protein FQN57_003798 [Myotisia sp. PD_48]|nr:hypothetical protein FQN57_003798 [Myotisia sp. PD_48]
MDIDSVLSMVRAQLLSLPRWATLSLLGSSYLLLVQILRFRRVRKLHEEFNYSTRASYATMTDTDAWKIQKSIASLEFPFIYLKSLQFALFKTYGIPTISDLLYKTTEFIHQEKYMKRNADTAVLINEFVGHPPASSRAHEGIARMNYLHKGYRDGGKILDDDMVYTISLFALEPARWINRYEWRELTELEKCALGTFWKSVGDAMLIKWDVLPSSKTGFKDGLQWFEEIDAWSRLYEVKAMVPSKSNHLTANATVDILLVDIPSVFQPLAHQGVRFLMESRLRIAMMYDEPGLISRMLFSSILGLRKFMLRHLFLPRLAIFRKVRTSEDHDAPGPHSAYEWEGDPYYVKPTLLNRWGPMAWYSRALGRPLPGDDGDKYFPNGFDTADVGPKIFVGKGREHFESTKKKFAAERKGMCPFAVSS